MVGVTVGEETRGAKPGAFCTPIEVSKSPLMLLSKYRLLGNTFIVLEPLTKSAPQQPTKPEGRETTDKPER